MKNQSNPLATFCAISTLLLLNRSIKKYRKKYTKKVSVRGLK